MQRGSEADQDRFAIRDHAVPVSQPVTGTAPGIVDPLRTGHLVEVGLRVLRIRPQSVLGVIPGSTWPPIYAAQWLLERLTIRAAGKHFTHRQLPLVRAAGFEIVEAERLKAGTVERISARKPLSQ